MVRISHFHCEDIGSIPIGGSYLVLTKINNYFKLKKKIIFFKYNKKGVMAEWLRRQIVNLFYVGSNPAHLNKKNV